MSQNIVKLISILTSQAGFPASCLFDQSYLNTTGAPIGFQTGLIEKDALVNVNCLTFSNSIPINR